MDRNLPATQQDSEMSTGAPGAPLEPGTPIERRQPISVAFLPLALVTFLVLAFIIAAWTFLTAAL